MNDAIEIVYYIYQKMIDFLFNTAVIMPGVSLGWIAISVVVFGILVNSFLVVPRGAFTTSVNAVKESEKHGG